METSVFILFLACLLFGGFGVITNLNSPNSWFIRILSFFAVLGGLAGAGTVLVIVFIKWLAL